MVTNKQIAKAFRDCMPFIACNKAQLGRPDKNEYICHALGDVTTVNYETRQAARDIIEARLGRQRRNTMAGTYGQAHTVYSYLAQVLKVPTALLTDTRVQRYRRAWVKELAKEFQTKG